MSYDLFSLILNSFTAETTLTITSIEILIVHSIPASENPIC